MEVLPQCTTTNDIRDLFWHPFMGDKWAPLVREQAYVPQAMQMVLTGANGPRHVGKGLVVATLSTHIPHQLPKVMSVAEPLGQVQGGSSFVVDCPAAHLPVVLQTVLGMGGPLDVRLGRASRSPGSSEALPRCCIEFVVPPSVAEFSMHMLLTGLRQHRWPMPGFLVAARTIYSDGAALLVELADSTALIQMAGLCREALYLSPKLATVTTDVAQAEWQRRVDEIWTEDPAAAVLRIKWRPSRMGGRTWVAPAAPAASIRAARAPAAATLESAGIGPRTAELSASGSLGYDPGAVVQMIMGILRVQAGVDLAATASPEQLRPGTWRRIAEDDPTADPSRVRLYLRSAEEGERIKAALHERAVQVGADLITLRVETVSVTVPRCNRRGGGRQREGPPPTR
jgi:hypothetical protein